MLFAGVVVVAAAAGGGLRWLQHYKEDKAAGRPEVVQAEVDEAQNVAIDGDFDKAHKTISEALDNPQLSKDSRYALLFQQGITYEGQKKYDEAIASYKEAEAIEATNAAAEAVARTAEAKGDKALAIEYYKKAIRLVDPNKPNAEGKKDFYERSIVNLGGQP